MYSDNILLFKSREDRYRENNERAKKELDNMMKEHYHNREERYQENMKKLKNEMSEFRARRRRKNFKLIK